ncbi:hypothetical protein ACIBF1_22765 [Spirillospora sp. NPDC050679]
MSPVVRRALSALGAAVLLASSAGCLGGEEKRADPKPPGGTAGTPVSTLVAALQRVASSDSARRHTAFSDLGRLRKLAGGRPLERDTRLSALTIGLGDLGAYGSRVAEPTGIDVARADRAVQVGVPPMTAGWLSGPYKAADIGAKLEKLGHKRAAGGKDTWVAQADGRFDLNDPLVKLGLPPTHPLNAVRVHEEGGITHARRPEALDAVRPGGEAAGPSLGADPAVRPVADCLGLPVAALISKDAGGADQIGAGVTGDSADALSEVLCVKVSGDAGAAAERLKQSLAGKSVTGRPWSELLPGAQVAAASGGVVRLTARTGAAAKPGVLFQGVMRGDLPRWTA